MYNSRCLSFLIICLLLLVPFTLTAQNWDVVKLAKGGELYSIQIEQDYYSTTYGDHGYLFLMVDLNDAEHPLIKVRTWQPEKDPNFGLYGPGDFK